MEDEERMENGSAYAEEGEDKSAALDQAQIGGKVRISEDVIAQIAIKALASVSGVVPATPGLMANLRMGRKTVNGIRIALSDGDQPDILVDAYISVKYGLRIPDVCWDVQEAIKDQVERYSGYAVRSVNVYVQGITFADKEDADGDDPSDGAGHPFGS